MEILNTPIGLGKSKVLNLNIAKLHTRTSLSVPIIVERGREPGPCVLLMASKLPGKVTPVLVKDSKWIRAKHSGMFRTKLKLGSQVSKGDKIGSISDPYGDFEVDVVATNDGYIIASNHAPIVNQGDALVHISTKTSLEF